VRTIVLPIFPACAEAPTTAMDEGLNNLSKLSPDCVPYINIYITLSGFKTDRTPQRNNMQIS
jgi:hypothetical protein